MTLFTRSTLWLAAVSLSLPPMLPAQRAPANVAAAFDAKGSVLVSWSGVKGAASYRVLRAPDPKSPGMDLTRPLDPSMVSFLDQKVNPGVSYFYQVIAVYGDGSEGASLPVQLQPQIPVQAPPTMVGRAPRGGVPLAPMPAPMPTSAPPPPPPAPAGLTVTAPGTPLNTINGAARVVAGPPPTGITIIGTPAEAMVKWLPTPGAASYRVTRQEPGSPIVQMAVQGPGWTDKGLRPSKTYTYFVDALYPDGRVGTAQMAFTTPPAINPSGFTAVPAGVGTVKLTWRPVSDADYYIVIGPGSSSNGVKVVGLTTYTVTGAPAGQQTWLVASYYDPTPFPPGSPTVGPNAVSTPASMFPRASATVPAAPVSTAHWTSFNPVVRGFGFINDFKNSFIGPPFNVSTGGLCGGMSYAALDYYNAGMVVPSQDFRPANNTTLQQYFYGRQVTSLTQNLDKWAELGVNPFGTRTLEFFNWGLNERLAELRSYIDRGVPVPLGLKGGGGPLDHRDHQVLAIGYDMGRYAGNLGSYQADLQIFILDPNRPNRYVTLVPDPGNREYYEKEFPTEKWQSYFVDGKYQKMTPPAAVNPVYPADGLIHELRLAFTTGPDDMRGGADHVDLTVKLANGTTQNYPNISQNGIWLPGYIETAQVILSQPVPQSAIKSMEIVTNAGGGVSGDNWDLMTVGIHGIGGPGTGDRNLLNNLAGPYRFTGARTPLVISVP